MNANGTDRTGKTPEQTGQNGSGEEKPPLIRRLFPWILWLILAVGTVLLFPRQGVFRYGEYTVGSISREEIIAPFTFEILRNEQELAAEREEARNSVAPVFVEVDSIPEEQLDKLEGLMLFARQSRDTLRTYSRFDPATRRERIRSMLSTARERYDVTLNENSWLYLVQNVAAPRWKPTPLRTEMLGQILRNLYARGVIDRLRENVNAVDGRIRVVSEGEERAVALSSLYDLSEARSEALGELNAAMQSRPVPGDSSVKVSYEVLVSLLVPNIRFDAEETAARREAAVAKVPIAKGIVLKNERIIDSNERITDRHMELLRSMEIKRAELAAQRGGWNRIMPWLGRFLLAGAIYLFFGYWLRRFRPDVFRQPNRLLLIWLMLALLVALFGLVFLRQDLNIHLYPVALAAVMLTIVFDARAAFIVTTALALIVGALHGNDLFTMLLVFLPGALSTFAVLRVRTRVQIMRASALIFAGFLVVILARRMLTYDVNLSMVNDLLFAATNSLATPLVALGLLILVEPIFRVTSDLTLLELADLNRPLLKRLSLEAPGTYHHSIMVGNLAEAAAEAIDANPLLVRAGAYYHDIGKMAARQYFVENQLGTGNIHDTLEPEESAAKLAFHVEKGVDMAEDYHLPEAIRNFIREHHGTSLMVYFYNKALELRPEGKVQEEQFRYPGPKPQSKETGILMLADSAEAATRSLDDPSPEKIQNAVREVIIAKYRDAELDECPLTLHDLRLVMEAFVPILRGIHHHRIQYPSREAVEKRRESAQKRKEAEQKEQENGGEDEA